MFVRGSVLQIALLLLGKSFRFMGKFGSSSLVFRPLGNGGVKKGSLSKIKARWHDSAGWERAILPKNHRDRVQII